MKNIVRLTPVIARSVTMLKVPLQKRTVRGLTQSIEKARFKVVRILLVPNIVSMVTNVCPKKNCFYILPRKFCIIAYSGFII